MTIMVEKMGYQVERVPTMEQLKDDDKRRHVSNLIDKGLIQGKADFNANQSSTTLQEAQEKAVMKLFATIEMTRREVQQRKLNQGKRERNQEDEENEKLKSERIFEKKWKEGDRVEKRIGNWRDFQQQGSFNKKRKKKV